MHIAFYCAPSLLHMSGLSGILSAEFGGVNRLSHVGEEQIIIAV